MQPDERKSYLRFTLSFYFLQLCKLLLSHKKNIYFAYYYKALKLRKYKNCLGSIKELCDSGMVRKNSGLFPNFIISKTFQIKIYKKNLKLSPVRIKNLHLSWSFYELIPLSVFSIFFFKFK